MEINQLLCYLTQYSSFVIMATIKEYNYLLSNSLSRYN